MKKCIACLLLSVWILAGCSVHGSGSAYSGHERAKMRSTAIEAPPPKVAE